MDFKKTLKVWWAFIWRYLLTMFVLGYLLGMFFGVTQEEANTVGTVLAIPVSFGLFYYILNKYFGKKGDQNEVE